ncbi:hypothetical protein IW140_000385 [Coemansia sp. RSA 1813]|nr:hypothetical protein EV178_000657 [Coemansia sp. RSA 1646]KAJ1773258.1 hypothetical protein LPJ74_000768 [Coemansia sp. RSA 1843]KAJ2092725.1 hypothetical protein IW138_000819 [Coemansia sp. RSA 986]KAJ2217777.1 hypothetical protein EV179_000263 [Coemansia sp. RSA 487]KAJ2572987.1 hypothetical protein IW140_000385 [Coemansia sp. RSA 1813]
MKLVSKFTIVCASLLTACAAASTRGSALDQIEVERVRRLANALNVSDMGTQDMLKAAGDAKREFPHLLRLVDDVLENNIVKRIVDPVVDRVLPVVSNIVNPEHVYRFADNAVNAGFEVTDGLLRAVFGSDSGLGDILYRPRPKKPATVVPPVLSPAYNRIETIRVS